MAQFKNLPQGDLTAYYRFLNELGIKMENVSVFILSTLLSVVRGAVSRISPPGDANGPVPGAAAGQAAGEAAQGEDGDPGHAL